MKERTGYTLILGDGFAWLEGCRAKRVHAVVTDPPFGLVEFTPEELAKRREGRGGIWRLPQAYDGQRRLAMPRFTVLTHRQLEAVRSFHERLAPLLLKVLVPGGHVIIASQNLVSYMVTQAFVSSGFELRGTIARIVKTLRGGDRPKGADVRFPGVSVTPRGSWEPWLVFRKPCNGRVQDNLEKWGTGGLRRPAIGAPFRDVIEAAPARGEERRIAPHPSLKPQALMRKLVHAALPLGRGLVLDPFVGSGSTIAAAEALGLRSIGLEIDEAYYRMAESAVPKLAKLTVSPDLRLTP